MLGFERPRKGTGPFSASAGTEARITRPATGGGSNHSCWSNSPNSKHQSSTGGEIAAGGRTMILGLVRDNKTAPLIRCACKLVTAECAVEEGRAYFTCHKRLANTGSVRPQTSLPVCVTLSIIFCRLLYVASGVMNALHVTQTPIDYPCRLWVWEETLDDYTQLVWDRATRKLNTILAAAAAIFALASAMATMWNAK